MDHTEPLIGFIFHILWYNFGLRPSAEELLEFFSIIFHFIFKRNLCEKIFPGWELNREPWAHQSRTVSKDLQRQFLENYLLYHHLNYLQKKSRLLI